MRIALVTWAGLPELARDDRLLRDELVRAGDDVSAAVWDDPTVRWETFDAIVLRSTWDYHHRVGEFRAWLARLGDAPLWNPRAVVEGNLHKRYLLDLPDSVPSVLLQPGDSIAAVLAERGWRRAVVKPAVSATAFRTSVIGEGAAAPGIATEEVLVQPFVDEVVQDGEWSLIFLGEFSHAVLKRPAAGDFRVQSDFGGSAVVAGPEPHIIEQARAIVARIRSPWLYARVDGVVRDGRLLLMELELTEPSLFLDRHPLAPQRFAAAIHARLGERTR